MTTITAYRCDRCAAIVGEASETDHLVMEIKGKSHKDICASICYISKQGYVKQLCKECRITVRKLVTKQLKDGGN